MNNEKQKNRMKTKVEQKINENQIIEQNKRTTTINNEQQ
jgi:hypothetical protein